MNHHEEAWQHVKPQLFGTVCEVTTKKPWGFIEDKTDIINKTVSEFLKEDKRYDTILLHILSGEGESKENVLKCLIMAYTNAVKVVVLEHNPDEFDIPPIDHVKEFIEELYVYENWGRNLLYAFTTLKPLSLPQLSDKYLEDNIDVTYVNEDDHGICKNNLIYTHTSEQPIDFKVPSDVIWVIGGGIPLESMNDGDVLIDSVLRQCIYTATMYGVDKWKLDRLYKFKPIEELKENWLPHWRKAKVNGSKPSIIQHKSLNNLKVNGKNIYVSTVDKKHWKHLTNNMILDAWTEPRDIIKIYEN